MSDTSVFLPSEFRSVSLRNRFLWKGSIKNNKCTVKWYSIKCMSCSYRYPGYGITDDNSPPLKDETFLACFRKPWRTFRCKQRLFSYVQSEACKTTISFHNFKDLHMTFFLSRGFVFQLFSELEGNKPATKVGYCFVKILLEAVDDF